MKTLLIVLAILSHVFSQGICEDPTPPWLVVCLAECCDPAHSWSRPLIPSTPSPETTSASSPTTSASSPTTSASSPTTSAASGGATRTSSVVLSADASVRAFVLVDADQWTGTPVVLELALNGTVLKKTVVTGPYITWWRGFEKDTTRLFEWDAARRKFYFADANRTENCDGYKFTPTQPAVFYTIDAVSGTSTATKLPEAVGCPWGIAYHPESDMFLFSMPEGETIEQDAKIRYYSLSVAAGTVTKLALQDRGMYDQTAAYYAAFMTGTTTAGALVRVGFLTYNVQISVPGVSVTTMNATDVKSVWSNGTSPSETSWLWTAAREKGTDKFYSLAPSVSGTNSFAVVSWTPSEAVKPRYLASFADAHPDDVWEGYSASDVLNGTFASMVIGSNRRLAIAVYDTATNTVRQSEIPGQRFVETIGSINGFGLSAIR